MAEVNAQHEFQGNLEDVFAGLSSYEDYPEYIPGVVNIEVLDPLSKGAAVSVRYELNLIKKFHYTLNMYHNEPNEISWDLEDSNLMKKNNGSWKLKENGKGNVTADYSLDIKFKGLVPGAIVKKLTETSLPAMFDGFQELINSK